MPDDDVTPSRRRAEQLADACQHAAREPRPSARPPVGRLTDGVLQTIPQPGTRLPALGDRRAPCTSRPPRLLQAADPSPPPSARHQLGHLRRDRRCAGHYCRRACPRRGRHSGGDRRHRPDEGGAVSFVGPTGVAVFATFSLVSETPIWATVPGGAGSGSVSVTTPGGSTPAIGFGQVPARPTITAPRPAMLLG